jgi:hypothetical protein
MFNNSSFANFFLIIISVGLLLSCKKEKTEWSTKWSAPLVHGHLTLDNILPSENLTTNSEGYLSIVYNDEVFAFSLDTLIKLPDTTISQNSGIEFPSLDVTPATEITDYFEQQYILDEIQLKKVIIGSGTAEITIKSPWPGKTKIQFSFPDVMTPDGVFYRDYEVAAGSEESPAEASSVINMANFKMGLTGEDGTLYNTLLAELSMKSNEETETFTITSADKVNFEFSFLNLIPKYAQGYFGQYSFSDTSSFALPPMKKILKGAIDIDSIDLKISVRNGFNLIAQAEISLLQGFNSRTFSTVDLSFPQLGNTINIDPATGGYYEYTPSNYPININNSNANIIEFIEMLPDSIRLGYNLAINPFGNVTGGHDEFFPGSKLSLFLEGEFPLKFGANDLTIVDTFDISYTVPDEVRPNEGIFTLDYENGFPIGADAVFVLLDENEDIIDSIYAETPISAGVFDSGTFLTETFDGATVFNLNDTQLNHLSLAKRMMIIVSFSTYNTEKIKVNADAFLDFNLHTNLNIQLSL